MPEANVKKPNLRIAKESYRSMIIRRSFMWVKTAFVFLLLAYCVTAFAFLRYLYMPGEGLVLTRDVSFRGGLAPRGSFVYVDGGYNSASFVLDRFFVNPENLSLVQVEAGPVGKVYQDNGVVTKVGNQNVNIEGLNEPNLTSVADKYIVRCISGACAVKTDRVYLVSKESVIGEPARGEHVNDKTAVHEDFKE